MKRLHVSWFVLCACMALGGASLTAEEGCTPAAREAVVEKGIDVSLCVLANIDRPEAEIVAKCIAQNVTKDDILRVIGETHKAAAKLNKTGCGEPKEGVVYILVRDAGKD